MRTENPTAPVVPDRPPFNIKHAPRVWAYSQDMRQLARKFVLMVLADACRSEGFTFEGIEMMAAEAGVRPASKFRAQLVQLEKEGRIFRYRRVRPNGSQATDLIVLAMPREEPLRITDIDGMRFPVVGRRGEREPLAEANIVEEDLKREFPVQVEIEEPEAGISPEPKAGIPSSLKREFGGTTDPPVDPVERPEVVQPLRIHEASGSTARANEPPTTTVGSSDDISDDDYDVLNVLDAYDISIEETIGRRPNRRPGDIAAARELVARGAWEGQVSAVVDWGLQDTYSRPRLLNGFRSMAKCFDAIEAQYEDAPKLECRCGEPFKATPEQQKVLRRFGEDADLECTDCEQRLRGAA